MVQDVGLARLIVEVSKGSDPEDPEDLRAGGTWNLGTDLSHRAGSLRVKQRLHWSQRKMRKRSLARVVWDGMV